MNKIIVARTGWKKQVRLLWKHKKIMNCDLKGMMKNLDKILDDLGLKDNKEVQITLAFGSMFKLRTYGDIAVLSEEGYKEYTKLMDETEQEYGPSWHGVYPLSDMDDMIFEESDYTVTEAHLIKYLDTLLSKHDEIFFRIGGEDSKTLEKGDNWEYYILTKPELYVKFGDVCHNQLNMQCQYGMYYLEGLGDYPNLGGGIRMYGDTGNYHSLRIHKDDVERFVKRVKSVREITC